MTAAQRPVIALEFRGVGDTADFGFLNKEAGAVGLVRLDPLVDHIAAPLNIDKQARLIAERFPELPRLVLAYCGTAALALHVAALTEAATVLVDPYQVTAEDLHRDFARMCRSLAVEPPDRAPAPDLGEWEALVLTARDAMAGEHGGDEEAYEFVDDLFDRYRGWLRFLFASVDAGPVGPRAPITAVTAVTAKPPSSLGELVTEPGRVRTHRVVTAADTGTLDSGPVRELLAALVCGDGEE